MKLLVDREAVYIVDPHSNVDAYVQAHREGDVQIELYDCIYMTADASDGFGDGGNLPAHAEEDASVVLERERVGSTVVGGRECLSTQGMTAPRNLHHQLTPTLSFLTPARTP